MGVQIYLDISHSVTKAEWEKVYEETLELVAAFPLCEIAYRELFEGVGTAVAVKSAEHISSNGDVGWWAEGDLDTLSIAESFYLPRDLIKDIYKEESHEDALFGELNANQVLNDDTKWDLIYDWWGDKTQGEIYHIYILAIGCLIMDRLGDKANCYGDITRGQCKRAVELANQYLQKPIQIPDTCDMERLFKRIRKMPLVTKDVVASYVECYLGNFDEVLGAFIQKNFTAEEIEAYWSARLEKWDIRDLYDYFLMGFDLEEIFQYIQFDEEEQGKKFVYNLMDLSLHIADVDTKDAVKTDQDAEELYGVATQFAQLFLGGCRNNAVERYIPLSEIKEVLKQNIGICCDVEREISEYLANKQKELEEDQINEAEIMNACIEQGIATLRDRAEKFTMSDFIDLPFYKKGDSIEPNLLKSIEASYQFYIQTAKDTRYKELMQKSHEERCKYLIEQSRDIILREEDWRTIFAMMEKDKNTFARYYPAVRVQCNHKLIHMVRAFMLNDAFWIFCKKEFALKERL